MTDTQSAKRGPITAGHTVLITGATGFLGLHAVKTLVDAGFTVRALCRGPAPAVDALGATVVRGDVRDVTAVTEAAAGCAAIVHGAGMVTRDPGDNHVLMPLHVGGMRAVMAAASTQGVQRVVHISTSGTVAVGTDKTMVFHEDDEAPLDVIHRWPYYLSKLYAERAADDAVRLAEKNGTHAPDVVTLGPSLLLGPGDARGSSTGDVRRFMAGQVPVVPTGGLSFVDVRDVAAVLPAALTAAPAGKYLLGGHNCTFADFFSRLETLTARRAPMMGMRVPGRLQRLGAKVIDAVSNSVGIAPPVSAMEVEMASHYWYVDARKAMAHLDFAPRDPMDTLRDTVRDLRG